MNQPIYKTTHQTTQTLSAPQLLDYILEHAHQTRASDIHFEPTISTWRIRFRIDGLLVLFEEITSTQFDAIISRIKLLAKMDIAERRLPQDGQFKIHLHSGLILEYRVSSLPTMTGEKIALRPFDSISESLSLESIGLEKEQAQFIQQALSLQNGLILVTGPTGSGKTFSLYCFLKQLNSHSLNICTVEDPTEMLINGLNQVSIRESAGLTFANTLRSFLRQDPDVIMIGEIRDEKTADIAIKAAQTGHLVFSTLHTSDACSAISRMMNLGVSAYNLANTLKVVTAQRLLRRLCPHCYPYHLQADSLIGCAHCHYQGYRGRVAIHQILNITPHLQELISQHQDIQTIRQAAYHEGMKSLETLALQKVDQQLTLLNEAQRVIGPHLQTFMHLNNEIPSI